MRRSLTTLAVLLLCGAPLCAEVVKGQIEGVDAAKGILTVTVEGKKQEFKIPAEAKIIVTLPRGERVSKEGLKDPDLMKGFRVEITTEDVKGKPVVKKVFVQTGRRVDG